MLTGQRELANNTEYMDLNKLFIVYYHNMTVNQVFFHDFRFAVNRLR